MAAVGGGAAGIEEGHRFVFVLHHDGYVVAVVPLTVLLKLKTATDAPDVFWLGFGEPADEVDVVDAHVEELAATPFGEFEGALDRGDRVDGVAADHDYAADFTAVDAGFGIEIGGVETAHETEHEDLVRIGFDGLFRESALSDVGTERLFGEYVLAVFERDADLFRMQGGWGDDDDGVELRILHISSKSV